MLKRFTNLIFIIGIVVFLFSGLVRSVCFPLEVNKYENRKAEKIERPSVSAFLNGDMQENMETAFADQAFFAQDMKQSYNNVLSFYLRRMCLSVAERNPNNYVSLGEQFLFGPENLVSGPSQLVNLQSALDKRIASYNTLASKYPELDFYLYYVEKDTDINFETGEKVGVFEYLKNGIRFSSEKKRALEINSFAEYAKAFYKTDHHWKYEGSHRGYVEVLDMLLPGEKPISYKSKAQLTQRYSGSKAQLAEASGFSEEFCAYAYDYPEMDILIHGVKAQDYGLQKEYMSGYDGEVSYGLFYGGDMGEIFFDTHSSAKDNLLVIGDSNDNAILKLLAGHFNRTVSVDLRYYEAYMGRKFSLRECVETHSIDKVLFIGNVDYYILDDFVVEE